MRRPILRDFAWMASLAAVLAVWAFDHTLATTRERQLKATTTDMAVAVQRHTELVTQMQQRLDEYENQHVLMRRFLRVAKERRD